MRARGERLVCVLLQEETELLREVPRQERFEAFIQTRLIARLGRTTHRHTAAANEKKNRE